MTTPLSTSRRTVMTGGLAGLGAAVLTGCATEGTGGHPLPVAGGTTSATRRSDTPNLIVIITDDQRWDHLSVSPSAPAYLSTPALDALAAQGARCDNAFVTTALCSPSRATFLTGLYARRHGVQNNLTRWNAAQRTVFEPLAEAGYDCAFIGKWHMPGGIPDLRGVNRFVTFTAQGGQGQYFDCPLLIDGVTTERPGTYISEDLTTLALEWISERPTDRPWCLFLAHKAVHHQFEPPEHLRGAMDGVDLSGLPPEAFSFMTTLDRNVWEGTVLGYERMYRRYVETLMGLDEQVGRLIKEIDLARTNVIYTSDNGYSWGEHVITGKRWAYEENTRVPFLAVGPDIARGTLRPELIINADVAPTLLEWAGVPWGGPGVPQGRSLAALLAGSSPVWREDFLYEYFLDFPYNVPAMQAARTNDWLYIEFESADRPQLFDVRADPSTQHDLMDDSPDTARELAARLAALRTRVASEASV